MLTSRQALILKLIVDDYIQTGKPVGSRTLSKRVGVPISPATIRNEMAELFEYGFIIQPHVSSGRLPSAQGIRYYIDSIMGDEQSADIPVTGLERLASEEYERNEKLLQSVADQVSSLLAHPVFITAPKISNQRLMNLKLMRISTSRALMIMVTDTEDVKSISFQIKGYSQEELDFLALVLLETYRGSRLGKFDLLQLKNLAQLYPEYADFFEYLLPALNAKMKLLHTNRVIKSGLHYIRKEGGYEDDKESEEVFQYLRKDDNLIRIAEGCNSQEILIGTENGVAQLERYSVVSGRYEYSDDYMGSIVVIGPLRMDYRKALRVVRFTAEALTGIFTGIHL